MNPLVFRKDKSTLRVAVAIALLTVTFLLVMPVVVLFAILHPDSSTVSALSTGQVTPTPVAVNGSLYDLASYPGDYYDWGNCTWWVSMRRSQIGEPIPNTWGNAATWAFYAQVDGYAVDHSPSPGAIMQIANVDGGLGHVAFVESVDPDGTWHISEMNVLGLDIVDYKAEPVSAASNFSFIHQVKGSFLR